jgi:Leucine-rich repeat (LRR) protein
LEVIPDGFDTTFSIVSVLDLSYNELNRLPSYFNNMKIHKLKLANNKFNDVSDSIWGSDYIFHLELDNNNISKISPSIQNANSLGYLHMSNNSLVGLPEELFSLNLYLLALDGNKLSQISEGIGNIRLLRMLNLHNNLNITEVPGSIQRLAKLRNIDLRNNGIEKLPEEAFLTLKKSLRYVYLHDNPICSNGWLTAKPEINDMIQNSDKLGAGCKAQCSIYCQDKFLNSNICGRECNSKACNFNNGVCRK